MKIQRHTFLYLAAIIAWPYSAAFSDVVLDGSLGQSGALSGPNYEISANYGKSVGNNLFHSFSSFNIQSGETANFSGPSNVTNIFSRVTGGGFSSINGTVGSNINGANLWLINPNGIVFGKDAKINVSGAFHATTADYIQFDNNDKFNASIAAEDTVLSIANPQSFGFLRDHPVGIIFNDASLTSAEGKTMSFVSGPITMTNSSLAAPSGRINIAAVATKGNVSLTESSLASTDVTTFESVNLINSHVSASTGTGGNIYILGGKVYLNRGSAITEQQSAQNTTSGIHISATDITIDGGLVKMQNDAAGKGGVLSIKSQTLTLRNDDNVHSESETGLLTQESTNGSSADIHVDVRDRIAMFENTVIRSRGGENGVAGNIDIKADHIGLGDSATIESTSSGTDAGGHLQIDVKNAVFDDSSKVSSSVVAGNGSGIRIAATERVVLNHGASIKTSTTGNGQGGNIDIDAKLISVSNQSLIETKAVSNGNAGNIALCGKDLVSVSSSKINATSSQSGGANIHIGSDNRVDFVKSDISASALGDNSTASGSVDVGACASLAQPSEGGSSVNPRFIVQSDSQISARSKSVDGGQVNVASDHIIMSPNSGFSSSGLSHINADSQVDTPPKEEEKAATIQIPLFVTTASQTETPCASTIDKRRGSFVAHSQVPMRRTYTDVYASGLVNVYSYENVNSSIVLAYGDRLTAGCGEN